MRTTVRVIGKRADGPADDEDPSSLDPVLTFLRQIWSVDHALQKMSKHMASNLGFTGPQRLALRIIGRHPGLAAGELAAMLHLDPSTVTGVLGRLQRASIVTREADPADARRSRLYLTTTGKDLYRRKAGTIEAAVRRALASLSEADISSASRVMAALARELAREAGKAELPTRSVAVERTDRVRQ